MTVFTGYRRPHGMTEALTAALVTALREHPEERFGQLVCNALGLGRQDMPTLFMIHDERSQELLSRYCENEPNAFGCEYGHLAHGGCALAATADSPPPAGVQLLDLLHELDGLRDRFRQATSLLDRFDRYSTTSDGYRGSPFEDEVSDFLMTLGMRT